MEGKEAIINKILDDAKQSAEEILQKAQNNADVKTQSANEWANEYTKVQRAILEKDLVEIIERRKTVANLDVRKLLLSAKQEVLSDVFGQALDRLRKLDKNDYLKLIIELVKENADQNDCLILSKDGVLCKKDIENHQVIKDYNITVSEEFGDFVGGVMLIGEVCDKDLTFEAVIDSKKEELSSEVAKRLF